MIFALDTPQGGQMKILKDRKWKRVFGVGLLLFMGLFLVSSGFASEDVCKEAMSDCLMDAVVAGLFSGTQTFLIYYSACMIGYTFCLKYYVQ
jgi:putative Mn2+ efflux pump MntP